METGQPVLATGPGDCKSPQNVVRWGQWFRTKRDSRTGLAGQRVRRLEGGADHEDPEGIQEVGLELQVQELLLIPGADPTI